MLNKWVFIFFFPSTASLKSVWKASAMKCQFVPDQLRCSKIESPPSPGSAFVSSLCPCLVLCRQPKKVGSCRAAFPRFYYDPVSGRCKSFLYGGCEANSNNFQSEQDCNATCRGVTGNFFFLSYAFILKGQCADLLTMMMMMTLT